MTRVLVRCDDAEVPARLAVQEWDHREHIRHMSAAADLNLRLENLEYACLTAVDPRATDLVRIAAYVYAADQAVGRGGLKDVHGRRWRREFHVVVPVHEPDFWQQPSVAEPLGRVLAFASDDLWSFAFTSGVAGSYQIPLQLKEAELLNDPNCVALFSGGADSLCAVIEAVAGSGLRPVLASHRPAPPTNARQQRLVGELRRRLTWAFPQISLWVHRIANGDPKENSQRTRAFLYASLGAAVAHELGVDRVLMADNGIVSINLPITEHLLGALATRSTHPKFLRQFADLASAVFGRPITMTNPLALRTRAEVLEILPRQACESLLQETISCAYWRGRSSAQPQCGVCSQCVDRRFGALAAGLQDHDLGERYETDVFAAPLLEGAPRTIAESFVRFARDVDHQSEEDLFDTYPQLYECIDARDPDASRTGHDLARLIKRHAAQVQRVIEEQISAHARAFVSGTVHPTSLLGMVAGRRHLGLPKVDAVRRVIGILSRGLPLLYQDKKALPANEAEVQRACEALFAAARERFEREVPLLPFAGISTKPDFSECGDTPRGWFFIEMKYPKDRSRLNEIVKEITSRFHVYTVQGAEALFCVYDPHRAITDDRRFVDGLSAPDGTWVEIVR